VAVREIESWALADHDGLKRLIGRRIDPPREPEGLVDPKRTLIELARRHAAKEVRLDLVPARGALATQGLGYNTRLVPWAQHVWDPEAAAQRAPSLARARLRLGELAASLGA
jgi:ADP-ribose pyrophosphatase YjhB (NUDIX family)